MSQNSDLTIEIFIDLLDCELAKYSHDYVPLHKSKENRIAKCCEIAVLDRSAIAKNPRKRRAHDILNDLWTILPEVFVLCASTIYVWHLGSLKSIDYLSKIKAWWKLVRHPTGLTTTVKQLEILAILPSRECAAFDKDSLSLRDPLLLESTGEPREQATSPTPLASLSKSCPFSGYNKEQWTLFHHDPRGQWLRSQYRTASTYLDEHEQRYLNIESRKDPLGHCQSRDGDASRVQLCFRPWGISRHDRRGVFLLG
jgi:hypothetical protein